MADTISSELGLMYAPTAPHADVAQQKVYVQERIQQHEILRQSIEHAPWVMPLITKLAEHSPWKFSHSLNVALLSYQIGTQLYGYNHEEALTIVRAGIVHDLGYIHVSDAIANKQGDLTSEEYEAQKPHVLDGMRMITPFDPEVAYIVGGHHQFITDAYPPRSSYQVAEDIRRKQEVLALADQVEALMAERPYKKGYSPEKTLLYLTHDRANNPTQFFNTEIAQRAVVIGAQFFQQAA